MNSEERYVFDTNVIISALLFNTSVPGRRSFGRYRNEPVDFLAEPAAYVEDHASQLERWSELCHVLLNTKEFIYLR